MSFCSKWRHFNFLNRSFSGMGEESFVIKILICSFMTILSTETQRGQIIFNWWFFFQYSPDFEWKSNWTKMTLRQVIGRVALASCSWISATYHNWLAVVLYVMSPFCQWFCQFELLRSSEQQSRLIPRLTAWPVFFFQTPSVALVYSISLSLPLVLDW